MKTEDAGKPTGKLKDRFVWVKDKDGKEYVCPVDALKNPEELTEEEKARCMGAEFPEHFE